MINKWKGLIIIMNTTTSKIDRRYAQFLAKKRAKDEIAAKENNMTYEEYIAYKKKKDAMARYKKEMDKMKIQIEVLEARYAEYEAKYAEYETTLNNLMKD